MIQEIKIKWKKKLETLIITLLFQTKIPRIMQRSRTNIIFKERKQRKFNICKIRVIKVRINLSCNQTLLIVGNLMNVIPIKIRGANIQIILKETRKLKINLGSKNF